MKKSLIALAALAATGAFAQSSVTLYGVADLSITRSKADGMAATTGLSNGGTINDGDSRIGLRGTEDLGGGVKASFNFEQFLDLENGQSRTDQGAGVSLWHRAAWMSLSGGFGSLRLGRTLSPNFYGFAAWDLTGAANYSTAANKFGFAGPSRLNSHIAYTTPNFGGFSATLGTTLKDDSPATGRILSANAIYSNGPLGVGLSYSKLGSDKESLGLGASYKMGIVTLAAAYMDPTGVSVPTASAHPDSNSKGLNLGVGVDIGPVNVVFEGARDTGSKVKTTDYALSARYPFSKRTFAYAAFYSNQAMNVSTTPGTIGMSTGGTKKTNSLGLGIRHNF